MNGRRLIDFQRQPVFRIGNLAWRDHRWFDDFHLSGQHHRWFAKRKNRHANGVQNQRSQRGDAPTTPTVGVTSRVCICNGNCAGGLIDLRQLPAGQYRVAA